ncbi:MAG: FAD-dependent thymidylate synthase [Synergistaceae bacterium]|jgi:thymidylate synthase (FAD)|nr:FAD-dependent thymidylate synthase [Synergistaceae bacterium]
MPPSVRLITWTPEADRLVAAAARLCYSPGSASELVSELKAGETDRLLKHLSRSGHLSPFEHASFVFGVDGISRACSHQLVRHRIASFSQQSQRYVRAEKAEVVIPRTVETNPEALPFFREAIRTAYAAYGELLARGVPPEDARYVLPNACETHLVVTMNARELLHFFSLRLCKRAQWEIREVARQMLCLAREKAPGLFAIAGPGCLTRGGCPEERPCGEPYSSMEDLLEKP